MIGNKIVEARKKINLSQAQLAQKLFISAQAVGKWERGESIPDIITFNRLAKIFGVDLNYFSENFQSVAGEVSSAETGVRQSDDLPSGNRKDKLSWDMSRGNWIDANFSGLKNLHEKFSSSNMKSCLFIGSDMSGILLKGNNVDCCDFSGSNMSRSQIKNSHLVKNLFKVSSFKDTEFSGSFIKGCDFSDADFTGVTVKSCTFLKNTIANAIWNHTTFITSQIADIVFDGTLDDCYFENCTFTRITFRNATLTNTFFKTRSLRNIKFIDCEADQMTYEFLKNGKADLTGIKLLS